VPDQRDTVVDGQGHVPREGQGGHIAPLGERCDERALPRAAESHILVHLAPSARLERRESIQNEGDFRRAPARGSLPTGATRTSTSLGAKARD